MLPINRKEQTKVIITIPITIRIAIPADIMILFIHRDGILDLVSDTHFLVGICHLVTAMDMVMVIHILIGTDHIMDTGHPMIMDIGMAIMLMVIMIIIRVITGMIMCTMATEDQFPQILTIIPTEVFPVTAEILQGQQMLLQGPNQAEIQAMLADIGQKTASHIQRLEGVVRHPQLLPGEMHIIAHLHDLQQVLQFNLVL
jgi:hypothetical protein